MTVTYHKEHQPDRVAMLAMRAELAGQPALAFGRSTAVLPPQASRSWPCRATPHEVAWPLALLLLVTAASKDGSVPLPACAAVMSPWTDLALTGKSKGLRISSR